MMFESPNEQAFRIDFFDFFSSLFGIPDIPGM